MKFVVCYSGGHSSALVAVEAVRKYGKDNVILLNHNISNEVEHEDIKRFKNDVADFLSIPITYANMTDWENTSPLEVAKRSKGFQFQVGQAVCTCKLKTEPFMKWLNEFYPASVNKPCKDITVLYGFDSIEPHRIKRRNEIMKNKGYKTDFPLAFWERSIFNIEEIGVKRPCTYAIFKHANCVGCLKAGRQHWYAVYCLYPDIFQKAIEAEALIEHSIIKNSYLKDLIPKFKIMKEKGIIPNDIEQSQTFWANANKVLKG